jgi:FtsZ-interacting cell division protein ZipA
VRHREESPVSSTAVVLIIVVLLVLVVLGIVVSRRRRSTQLQEHFGPEYERSVAATGDRRSAEAELAERRQRREEFDVRDLNPEERDRFRGSWNEIQRGFVDDPRQSLKSADLLVAEIMRARGYPVDDDFDRRADDLSVDHPRVVQHYREARQVRDANGEVDTERQRTAVTSYRSLVDALLGDDDSASPADAAHDTRHTEAEHADDRRDTQLRGDATDRTDGTSAGRHALHNDEPGAAGPDDPRGARSPRTEEHTR